MQPASHKTEISDLPVATAWIYAQNPSFMKHFLAPKAVTANSSDEANVIK